MVFANPRSCLPTFLVSLFARDGPPRSSRLVPRLGPKRERLIGLT